MVRKGLLNGALLLSHWNSSLIKTTTNWALWICFVAFPFPWPQMSRGSLDGTLLLSPFRQNHGNTSTWLIKNERRKILLYNFIFISNTALLSWFISLRICSNGSRKGQYVLYKYEEARGSPIGCRMSGASACTPPLTQKRLHSQVSQCQYV